MQQRGGTAVQIIRQGISLTGADGENDDQIVAAVPARPIDNFLDDGSDIGRLNHLPGCPGREGPVDGCSRKRPCCNVIAGGSKRYGIVTGFTYNGN